MTALAVVCGIVAAAAWRPGVPAQGRVNVVVLVIDDMRWDSLGAAGNRVVKTPSLDRLAARGVRFAQARVTTAICMVSRASLLTGQYMSRHGIDRFGKPLPPDAFANTYVGLLRKAGYWTGHAGKYDVGQPRADDYDFLRAYHGRHWIDRPDGQRVHVTEQNARDALDFLRQRPKDRPFLLTVGFFAPHAEDAAADQYLPQAWSAKPYDGARVQPSALGGDRFLKALPPFLARDANEGRIRFHWRFDTPERYQASMLRYFRLITEVDDAIDRIAGELEAQRVHDNTLIVVIGDNGYFHGDRGLADKWYPYEQALRVPLIVRDPRARAPRGRVLDHLALNIDVAPTVVAAAGLTPPAAMQGRDLAQVYARGRGQPWREEFFYEHPTVTSRDRIPSSQGVIRRDWKYVIYPEWEYEQLFDLKADPFEVVNLIDRPAQAARAAAMRSKAESWRQSAR